MRITNTPEGWRAFADQTLQREQAQRVRSPESYYEIERQLYMDITIAGPLDAVQFHALQYAFIECDRIESVMQRQYVKNLTVRFPADRLDDAYRILHYLYLEKKLQNELFFLRVDTGNVRVNSIPPDQEDINFGRLLPLLCIGTAKVNPSVIPYKDIVAPEPPLELRAHFDAAMAGTLTMDNAKSIPLEVLSSYYLGRIHLVCSNLTGTTQDSLSGDKKKILVKQLHEILLRDLPELSLLARLIWSCSLWLLAKLKALLHLLPNKEWELDTEAIHCSRLDAIAYAEGLQQLVENACLHSDSHRAYLSIRIHDTDIISLSDMEKHLESRKSLYARIAQINGEPSPYLLDASIKHYFEFQVINDSIGIDSRDYYECPPKGIAQKYYEREKREWPPKTAYNLGEIFIQTFKNPDDTVQHYGLRLLEKTVRLNGGYFCFSSPGKNTDGEDTKDIFQDFEGVPDELRFRSEAQQSPPLRCTSFYILLPVTVHWQGIDSSDAASSVQSCPLFMPQSLKQTYTQHLFRLQGSLLHNGGFTYSFASTDHILTPEEGFAAPLPFTGGDLSKKLSTIHQIQQALKAAVPRAETALCLLDLMRAQDFFTMELFAKALFLTIAEQEGPQLYALLLPSNESIWEFIRIFSVFYDRLADKPWMQAVQVALCSYPDPGKGSAMIPEVNFLLAGATSSAARVTARVFAYYNAGATLEMIPQLRYLTRDLSKAAEGGIPQFPFDLYLTAAPAGQPADKSWFLCKMDTQLQRDLWERPMGCRLHGIRVRLKSNICLSDFYEAELLFHNVGIIYRFAHLIASDILRQLLERREQGSALPDRLVLVGYEFYSSVLTQQVAALLNASHALDTPVHYLICYGQAVSGDPLHRSPELQNMPLEEQGEFLRHAEYVAIIPIGTTLSTLYHLQRTVAEQFPLMSGLAPLDTFVHYVLILVGSVPKSGSPRLSDQYWTKDLSGLVTLAPEKNTLEPLRCRVYLEPQATWHDRMALPSHAPCEEEVLVYVDKTSTLPKDIFVGRDTHFRGITPFLSEKNLKTGNEKNLRPENDRRVSLLKGCIHYGHLTAGNNHFQFYLDMDRYFAQASQPVRSRSAQTISAWLETLRCHVDANAYNIIVSPLHQEDSPFAKAVLDHVFEHSFRFLHANFADAFREDIRAKFSYVAEEYRQIRRYDSSRQVHVYFVNTAITSGSTLLRARNLILMLLEESGIPYDRGNVFKGCFVMVNRSGFDTLNSYVSRPLENFHAYVHLAVPSFNVERDSCPTCELVEKYRLIEERCATDQLRREFHRLAEKHARRDVPQYLAWLRSSVMTSCGYAGWLRQWLFSYVRQAGSPRSRAVPVAIFPEVDALTLRRLKQLFSLLEWGIRTFLKQQGIDLGQQPDTFDAQEAYLRVLNGFSLRDLKRLCGEAREQALLALDPTGRKTGDPFCLKEDYWRQVVLDAVCGQKNYLRLYAVHCAFLETETMPKTVAAFPLSERGRKTADILTDLITKTLQTVTSPELKMEWLISYLKVLSRPHLAQYHHIRQGILTLLLRMLEHTVGSKPEEEPPEFFSYLSDRQTFPPLLRYQLLQTILKRLAGLQSTYLLQKENMDRILKYVQSLRQEYFESTDSQARLFLPFPPMEEIRLAMAKLVKWSSSCGDDENGCFLIESEFKEEGRHGDR